MFTNEIIGQLVAVDLAVREDKPLFDKNKHYLGPLCIHGHDYQTTGKSWRHRGHNNCVMCTRERAYSWNKENPERVKANEKRRLTRLLGGYSKRKQKWPILFAITGAKNRSKGLEIPFDINAAYMRSIWKNQKGLCYWTGTVLDFRIGKDRDPRRPSLDRLIPKLGYVRGNVVWATNFANRARGDMEAEEFRSVLLSISTSVVEVNNV